MSFEFEESQNIPQEPPKQYVPDPPKRKRSGIGLVALCLCVSLLSGALGAAGVYAYMNRQSEVSEEEKNTVSHRFRALQALLEIWKKAEGK